MKLTEIARAAIKESQNCRNRLAYELKRDPLTIRNLIKENPENGLLTTVHAVKLIEEETSLTQDQIITA